MNDSPATLFAPGAGAWRPLVAKCAGDEAQEDEAHRAKGDLANALLASLKMQHLVVLAGSGCSQAAGGPSMKDLWDHAVRTSTDAEEVASMVHHRLADQNIEAFLSSAEAFLQVNESPAVSKFLDSTKKLILEKCSEFLKTDNLVHHKTFLHRLSRRRVRDQRLRVFTTNYDLCFELAAAELGGVALDGFSFTAPRRYDPRFFAYDIIRRPRNGDDPGHYLEGVFILYKLHGSVNWARAGASIYQKEGPTPEEACLIYPARGKYQQSFVQPHLESMAQYLAAVREPNTCLLVVGFGFNDDHLAEPLLAAVESNPHLRLIVADRAAQQNVDDGNEYWKRLFALSQRSDDVWIINASFGAFANMIPDLKSLTPADTLLNAVRGATSEA